MDVRPRHVGLIAALALVAVLALGAVLEAAGNDVAVAVSVAAIAVLVASYVRTTLVSLRAAGQEDATERVQRWARVHIAIMMGAPLVLLAARPWGPLSLVVGFGVLVVCHFLYIHTLLIAGFLLHRRARHRVVPRVR